MSWLGVLELALVGLALLAVFAYILGRERAMRRRMRLLADVAAVSDRATDLDATLDAITAALVPEFADFCMVDVIERGQVRRAASRVVEGAAEGVPEWLAARDPSVPEWMLSGDDEEALQPRFYERLTERDLRDLTEDEEDLEMMHRLAPRSAITLALRARGRVTGTLTLGVSGPGRRYREEDAQFAWILSGRVALALDNAGLFSDLERAERARAQIGLTLQRSLLPPPLPQIPGWTLAASYRPAGAENEVGGDFYDAFRVPGGWLLVIGDVTGRGASAASVTSVARYTLRTAAMLADDPLVALDTLNRALLERGDAALCSLAAVTLSEDSFEPVRLAVAGHPPPLLVDGDDVGELAGGDPVLGAFADAEWSIARVDLEPGQQLTIVTDGIAEAVAGGERFGERRLRAELAGADSPRAALQRLEGALDDFVEGELLDDVAILALAREPT